MDRGNSGVCGTVGYFDRAQDLDFYVSRAKIVTILESLEKFFARYGEGRKTKSTAAMDDGQIYHEAVLRPAEYQRRLHVHRFKNFQSNDAKFWRNKTIEETPDAIIMSEAEIAEVEKIVDAVNSDPLVRRLLNKALKETHGYAKCPKTGIWLYSRPDIVTEDGFVAELKFVKSVDFDDFDRQQFYEKWYIQLAFYNYVHCLINGIEKNQNVLYIAVENEYPHRVRCFTFAPNHECESLPYEEMGMIKVHKGIELVDRFRKADPTFTNRKIWFNHGVGVRQLKPKFHYLNNDPDFNQFAEPHGGLL